MDSDDFMVKVSEALELDNREISLADNFREYEEWDSLTFLSLMTMMHNEYGVNLDIDDFNGIDTWQELYNLIRK